MIAGMSVGGNPVDLMGDGWVFGQYGERNIVLWVRKYNLRRQTMYIKMYKYLIPNNSAIPVRGLCFLDFKTNSSSSPPVISMQSRDIKSGYLTLSLPISPYGDEL